MDVAVIVRLLGAAAGPGRWVMDERDDVGIAVARQLRDQAGGGVVTAIAVGGGGLELRRALALGADRAVMVEGGGDDAGAVAASVLGGRAEVVVAVVEWTDAAPARRAERLAERLGRPLVSFASSVGVDGSSMVAVRPADDGIGDVEVRCPRPVVVTVTAAAAAVPTLTYAALKSSREAVVERLVSPDTASRPVVNDQGAPLRRRELVHDDGQAHRRILERLREVSGGHRPCAVQVGRRVDPVPERALAGARIIVAAGRGLDDTGFATTQELARLIGAALAGTGPTVDAALLPASRLVGQSGTTVAPAVYLAVGVSGAGQHLAGLSGAGLIMAVNHDPAAPIMAAADLAVAGDAQAVLSHLVQAVTSIRHSP